MLKNKKGGIVEFILTPAFTTTLVLGLVLLYLLWFVNGISTKTTFERQYLARDLALLIDAALSVPGNLNIVYEPVKDFKSDFTFEVTREQVIVSDEGSNSYPYSLRKNTKLKSSPVKIPRIVKTGSELVISEEKVFPQKLPCYEKHSPINHVIIDAGHFNNPKSEFNDPGYEYNNIVEADLTFELGRAIKSFAKDLIVETTRHLERATEGKQAGLDAPISVEERIDKIKNSKAHSVISLHFNNDEKFYLKAFVHPKNYEHNYIIACNLLNKISESIGQKIDGLAIIPLDPSHMGDKNYLVLNEKDSVLLEIGTVKNPLTDKELLNVAKAIIQGLK